MTTYSVKPTMSAGNHAVSFRVCNAGGCSTSTSPFTFLVPAGGNPSNVVPGPVVPLQALQASHTDNKCLDVSDSSTENGSTVIQWQCHGGDNQAWRIERADDGYNSRLVSRHSGKCLDVRGESKDDGAPVIQWQCHGGANQQWRLEAVGTGYRLLRATAASAWMSRGRLLTMAQPLFSGSVTAAEPDMACTRALSALGNACCINDRA